MALLEIVRYLNARQRLRQSTGFEDGDALEITSGRIEARFLELRLHTVFQPIVDLTRGQVVAHEALLRAKTTRGLAVSPEDVFARPRSSEELVYLDRLSRTLHALNFVTQPSAEPASLYLNVDPRHLLAAIDHGLVFESILRHTGLAPEQVVLEVLESAIEDSSALTAAIHNFRGRGFRVAVDDFGRGHANFDRLWQLEPDVVKLDRHLLLTADRDRKVRAVLPKLVDVAKAHGALVLFEGVETEEHLEIVLESGAELAQGYLLGRPERVRGFGEAAWPSLQSERPSGTMPTSGPSSSSRPKAGWRVATAAETAESELHDALPGTELDQAIQGGRK